MNLLHLQPLWCPWTSGFRKMEMILRSLDLDFSNNRTKGGEITMQDKIELVVEELEERIAPSSANFPPGQFPSGNPAHAPGNSNPNEHPADNGAGP